MFKYFNTILKTFKFFKNTITHKLMLLVECLNEKYEIIITR